MATMTRKPEQVKPVTGTVRWLKPLIVGKQLGRLSITNGNGIATEYDIDAFQDNDGAIVGLGLAKDDDEIHSVDVTPGYGWQCDCPDATFHPERPGGCKHVKAVRAALKSAGIEIPVPQRQQAATPARKVNPVCCMCNRSYEACQCTV